MAAIFLVPIYKLVIMILILYIHCYANMNFMCVSSSCCVKSLLCTMCDLMLS